MTRVTRRIRGVAVATAWLAAAAAILCFALPGATSRASVAARDVMERAVEAKRELVADGTPGWRIERAAVLQGSGTPSLALAIAPPRPGAAQKP